jgi:hypothetical protein
MLKYYTLSTDIYTITMYFLACMMLLQDVLTRLLARAIALTQQQPAATATTSDKSASIRSSSSTAIANSTTANTNSSSSSCGSSSDIWPYLEKCAQILMSFSKSDKAVKEGMASEICLAGIYIYSHKL